MWIIWFPNNQIIEHSVCSFTESKNYKILDWHNLHINASLFFLYVESMQPFCFCFQVEQSLLEIRRQNPRLLPHQEKLHQPQPQPQPQPQSHPHPHPHLLLPNDYILSLISILGGKNFLQLEIKILVHSWGHCHGVLYVEQTFCGAW